MAGANDSRYLERLLTLIAVAAAVVAAYVAKAVLLPIALAVLLSFVLAPLVARLERLRLGRVLSVAMGVSLAAIVVGILGWVFIDQTVQLGRDLPDYRHNLIEKIHAVRGTAQQHIERARETIQAIGKELNDETRQGKRPAEEDAARENWLPLLADTQQPPAADRAGRSESPVAVRVVEMPGAPLALVLSWLGPLAAPLTIGAMAFVLMTFILISREDQLDRVIRLFGPENAYVTKRAIGEATERVSRFLWAALLVNAIFGVVTAVGLWLIGVPNAMLWGVLALALRFLPYLGAWISAAMPIALSLVIFDGWTQPLLVIGLFVVAELTIANLLEPLIFGHSMGISPIGVLIAAIFWTWLWGPIGLVLAMPMTVCLVVAAQYIPQLRFLNVLLGDRPTGARPSTAAPAGDGLKPAARG